MESDLREAARARRRKYAPSASARRRYKLWVGVLLQRKFKLQTTRVLLRHRPAERQAVWLACLCNRQVPDFSPQGFLGRRRRPELGCAERLSRRSRPPSTSSTGGAAYLRRHRAPTLRAPSPLPCPPPLSRSRPCFRFVLLHPVRVSCSFIKSSYKPMHTDHGFSYSAPIAPTSVLSLFSIYCSR